MLVRPPDTLELRERPAVVGVGVFHPAAIRPNDRILVGVGVDSQYVVRRLHARALGDDAHKSSDAIRPVPRGVPTPQIGDADTDYSLLLPPSAVNGKSPRRNTVRVISMSRQPSD